MYMKVTIEAPDNLNEITLGQYQEFLSIEDPNDKDVLKVFLRLSDNIISKIPKAQIMAVSGQIVQAISKGNPKFIKKFTLNGTKFGFIPNLDEISSGEYDDACEYLPRSEQDVDKTVYHYEDFHRCMAVLFRPITLEKKGKYLIEDYQGSEKYAETMKQMPLGVALGCLSFFFDLLNELLKTIPNYLEDQVRKTGFSQSGEDTTDTTPYVEGILKDLKTLQNFPFIRAS